MGKPRYSRSEYSRTLRLVSKLTDLRVANANWISRGARKPNSNREERFQNKKPPEWVVSCFGAATQIRTGDLILTKDVLYQLSHSSIATGIPMTFVIITNVFAFVNRFLKYLAKNPSKFGISVLYLYKNR